ncbi:MAG TPA: MltA domain-containing protein [Syntrophales bacterium]|nr:MltA domain-containing protein [Syntrophales bacterium]
MVLFRILCLVFCFLILAGCAGIGKTPEKISPTLVLIPPERVPPLTDDLAGDLLSEAIDRSMEYYQGNAANVVYSVGGLRVTGRELRESLLLFRGIMRGSDPDEIKREKILRAFDIYRASGFDGEGRILFTGYFESVLKGSLIKTDEYKYPVYKTPDDIIVVNLGRFSERYRNDKLIGRLKGSELVPYFTRADIEEKGVLKGKNLELFWVDDPVDLFFMHIQGSGEISLTDGRTVQVSYAQKNGRPNRMAGYLFDKGRMSRSGMTYQSVKKYMREHPEELSDILNYNESYVFFRIVENGPVGALGLTLTSGRSIATDLDIFPRGALAFIKLRKPVFQENGDVKSWSPFSRFVLNQDTGGVIKGPGRVDLFCGKGKGAEMVAGSLKENGELYFLLLKKSAGNGEKAVRE